MAIDYEARAARKHERDVHDAALASVPGREWFGAMKARLKLHLEAGGDGQRHGLVLPPSKKIAKRLAEKREIFTSLRETRKMSRSVGSYTQNLGASVRYAVDATRLPDFYLPSEEADAL